MNVLTEVKWLITNKGKKTVKEIFSDETLKLSEEVPGFVYGAQFRFLMTIIPLLRKIERSESFFKEETIEEVFSILEPYTDLFSETNPFLQISSYQVDGKQFGLKTDPSKLFPHGKGVDDNSSKFWNFDEIKNSLSIEDAVLSLVVYYFYSPGTNTALLKGNNLKLTNGSSALQYLNSVEIIAVGKTLVETLLMNTPKKFIDEAILPHWADRSGSVVTDPTNPLWRFSWSSNTVNCEWDENRNLVGITRGGVPIDWNRNIPMLSDEKYPKTFHNKRQESDPLYFYTLDTKNNSYKLKRLSLSSDPYYTVAQWNADNLSVLLTEKWSHNELIPSNRLENLIFLEHSTEGASSSFSIRYSAVVMGYRDELFPTEKDKIAMETISNRYKDVLIVRAKLLGFFSENGTCNFLKNRRNDVDKYFWDELHDFSEVVVKDLSNEEIRKDLVNRAIKAFTRVSSNRDSIHIDKHLNAIRMLKSTFWEKK